MRRCSGPIREINKPGKGEDSRTDLVGIGFAEKFLKSFDNIQRICKNFNLSFAVLRKAFLDKCYADKEPIWPVESVEIKAEANDDSLLEEYEE